MANLSFGITAPSSTPSRGEAIFSDAAAHANTPPSSPPGFPWERLQQTPDAASEAATTSHSPPRKNAFSVLGKRKPLENANENARPKKQSKASKTNDGMVQMQMSLGQEVQKRCAQCGMEYTASSTEDRKLHDKFHKQNVEGYDVGKDFVSKTAHSERHPRRFRGVNDGDTIILLDCTDPWQRKRKGQAVLEIVQKELGAVEIPEKDIWDAKGADPRFRAYLYIRGTNCVGFLLAERITEAFEVLQAKDIAAEPKKPPAGKMTALAALQARKDASKQAFLQADRQPIQLSTSKTSAVLGISRIWTSPTHRGQGIAKCLLDAAHSHDKHNHSLAMRDRLKLIHDRAGSIEDKEKVQQKLERMYEPKIRSRKTEVAFSQPTESGAKLARRWVGKPYGWLVYVN